jgi:predicted small secreted protein
VLALALLLAGCDKCGNWNLGVTSSFGLDACRNTVAPQ